VSEPMNIAPELLIVAGAAAEAQSQDLLASHNRTDAIVDSALPGWVGRSATALAGLASMWAATTLALSARLHDHGEALRLSGLNFAEVEVHGTQSLEQWHRPSDTP